MIAIPDDALPAKLLTVQLYTPPKAEVTPTKFKIFSVSFLRIVPSLLH